MNPTSEEDTKRQADLMRAYWETLEIYRIAAYETSRGQGRFKAYEELRTRATSAKSQCQRMDEGCEEKKHLILSCQDTLRLYGTALDQFRQTDPAIDGEAFSDSRRSCREALDQWQIAELELFDHIFSHRC